MVAQTDPSTVGTANSYLEVHHDGTNGESLPLDVEPPAIQLNGNGNPAEWNKAEGGTGNLSGVFVVSADDADTTRVKAKNLASYLSNSIKKGQDLSPADVAYTLAEHRAGLNYTAAVRASTLDELVASLDRPQLKIHKASEKKRLGFVFNGQGAQWHAMGRELLVIYPVFAAAVKEADDVLRGFGADWSLQEELLRDAESTRLSEIHISQPSTVALQLALVKLLRSWNIHPSAVVSHSTGEFAAAYTAGALSFSQALGIVYHFGDLARKYHDLSGQPGDMAAAAISSKDVEKYMTNTSAGGQVVVACINSPKSITLSGDRDDLDEVMRRLDEDGIFVRKLKVPMAYHSHHMLPLAAEYTERLREFLPSSPTWIGDVVYGSPVTGAVVDSSEVLTPEYYVRNITSPVLFSDAFTAVSQHIDLVVEIGPHSTLSGPIRDILESEGREMGYATCLKRPVDAIHTMQDLACDLVGFGYPVSLHEVNLGTDHHKFVPDLLDYQEQPEVLRGKSVWEPDILHNIPKHVKDSMRIILNQDEIDAERTLVRASYFFITDAVVQLQGESQEAWTSSQKELLEWMVAMVELGKRGDLGPGSALWSRATRGMKQMLYDELNQGHDVVGRLVARVGGKLADIVPGHISPLELAKEGDLLNKCYSELPSLKSRTYKHLSRATELFAIKNPGPKVLEIGAGTVGATRAVLDGFGSRGVDTGGTLLGHYVFTHKDGKFLEDARRNLAYWDDLIEFHTLDIDQDPITQSDSFAAGTFDLIVASTVFGETRGVNNTLVHARKLLKPGGKLFLVEPTEDAKLDVQLISRILALPVGLSNEDEWNPSPVSSINSWDKNLRDTGFTGVEFEIADNVNQHYQSSSFIISTATTTSTLPSVVSIVYTTPVPEDWHGHLITAILQNSNISSAVLESLDDLEPQDILYIFTGDLAGPFLQGIDQTSFTKLRKLLVTSSKVLWLSHGGVVDAKDPAYAQTYGYLRTSRREDPSKRFIHLDFEKLAGQDPLTSQNIGHVVHVLRHTMNDTIEIQDLDQEYAVKDSTLHVPRVLPVLDDTEAESKADTLEPIDLSDPDATFLVVNGLGGIGQEVTEWMMGKGARNLLIVSHHVGDHAEAASAILSRAEEKTCNLQIRHCDVSSEGNLVGLLREVGVSMPAIRGVVVAPVALDEVAALEDTGFDQWKDAVEQGVDGITYLDAHLPPDLSFFIILSSLLETHFSAGSTFQDSFARNRVAAGKPVTSISVNLGDLSAQVGASPTAIPIESVLSQIEAAIRHPPVTLADAQVIVGLPSLNTLAPGHPIWRDRRFGTLRLGIRRAISSLEFHETTTTQTSTPSDLLVQALENEQGEETVALTLKTRLAVLLHVQAEEIDLATPLALYGVDSIVAVDLRSWLASVGSAKLSVLEILNAVSLHEVAKLVIARTQLRTVSN